jgi:hypothetical protein
MTVPIQLQRLPSRRKKPANKRALLLLALLIVLLCAALAGCSAQAADATVVSAAELKQAAAGAWLCPGMHTEWLDAQTVQCLKEQP